MIDLIEKPREMYLLIDKVCQHVHKMIQLRKEFDGIFFGDHAGMESGLMMSPTSWREIFKPKYAEFFRLTKEQGQKIFFHGGGDCRTIIEDLLDIGADVVLISSRYGKELRKCLGKDLCFLSGPGSKTLVSATLGKVVEAVKRTADAFSTAKGGLIFSAFINPDMPMANIQAMFEAFHEY